METDLHEETGPPDFEMLASFSGEPSVFWKQLTAFALESFSAEAACLLLESRPGVELRVLAQEPSGAAQQMAPLIAEIQALSSWTPVELASSSGSPVLAFNMPARDSTRIWMVIEGAQPGEMARLAAAKEIRVLADLYQSKRQERRTEEKLLTLSEVLDIGLALGESHHFDKAGMRICNEVATQMVATRVSLAWLEGTELKLKATSHGGVITKQSEEAKALERLMEESLDQDNEVSHPPMDGSNVVAREHKAFSKSHDDVSVLSLPLRGLNGACGILCVEKAVEDGGWSLPEIVKLRLMADLFASRLDDLHLKTGWLGRRLWRKLRKGAAGILGPEHTGWKLTGSVLLLGLILAAVVPMEYKVKAPFILKTDAAAVVTSPFSGYIEEVAFNLGDRVESGQLMVGLDQRELLLQRADTAAGRNMNANEARSYEAEGKLAEMRVSQAQQEQAESRLDIINHRLGQTRIMAPFDGVVVEGDLREKLSSPVEAGEALFKIVQLRELFGQLQMDERDVSYLKAGLAGELAFSSRPGEKFSVRVDRFEPVAEVRSEGTIFLLRAQIEGEPQDWWRPGMGGVCKIHTGKRSVLWIATHRLVEVIRLWLWV